MTDIYALDELQANGTVLAAQEIIDKGGTTVDIARECKIRLQVINEMFDRKILHPARNEDDPNDDD